MAYATQQDMEDRFGAREIVQLTDRAIPPAGAVDVAVLNQALADAERIIDARLMGRYPLPLAVVPEILTTYACDIARYRLYEDRPTDTVRQRYEDAVRFLDAVGKGQLSLGLDAADQPAAQQDVVRAEGASRVFTRETLSDY